MNNITLFGCGAVGSMLVMGVSHHGYLFRLIDDDRIDENNIDTSAFYKHHIGAHKAVVLSEMLYRKAGCISAAVIDTVDSRNVARYVNGSTVVLDCFDNAESRRLLCGLYVPTLHVGVSRERTGAVVWDEDYILPDGAPRGEDEFCTHQAGRSILRATAAVAARIVEQFLAAGDKRSVMITEDFGVYE